MLHLSTWSLVKLADFLVAEGGDDISHEGLRILLREEGVTFQCVKTWKTFKDPDYAAKKAHVEHLYAIADREVRPPGTASPRSSNAWTSSAQRVPCDTFGNGEQAQAAQQLGEDTEHDGGGDGAGFDAVKAFAVGSLGGPYPEPRTGA